MGLHIISRADNINRVARQTTDHHVEACFYIDVVNIGCADLGRVKCGDHSRITTVGQHFQFAFVTMHEVAAATDVYVVHTKTRNDIVDAIRQSDFVIAADAQIDGFDQLQGTIAAEELCPTSVTQNRIHAAQRCNFIVT